MSTENPGRYTRTALIGNEELVLNDYAGGSDAAEGARRYRHVNIINTRLQLVGNRGGGGGQRVQVPRLWCDVELLPVRS